MEVWRVFVLIVGCLVWVFPVFKYLLPHISDESHNSVP